MTIASVLFAVPSGICHNHRMKIILLILIVLTKSALLAQDEAANQNPSKTTGNPHQLLFVLPESIPYHYLDEDTGRVVGTLVDRFNHLITNAGLGSPDYAIYSWKRALAAANSRPATLIMPLSRTPEREEKYHWLALLRETHFSIFSLNEDAITPERIQREDITIYCENGGIQCSMLEATGVPGDHIQLFEGISHDRVVDLAVSGRIKYFLAEQDLVEVGLKERGLDQSTLKVVYTIDRPVQDYLAMAIDNEPTLVDALKRALSKPSDRSRQE